MQAQLRYFSNWSSSRAMEVEPDVSNTKAEGLELQREHNTTYSPPRMWKKSNGQVIHQPALLPV